MSAPAASNKLPVPRIPSKRIAERNAERAVDTAAAPVVERRQVRKLRKPLDTRVRPCRVRKSIAVALKNIHSAAEFLRSHGYSVQLNVAACQPTDEGPAAPQQPDTSDEAGGWDVALSPQSPLWLQVFADICAESMLEDRV